MENSSRPLLRLAPVVVLLVVVYALGRWQGGARGGHREPESETSTATEATPGKTRQDDAGEPAASEASRVELSDDERLRTRVDELVAAARKILLPDAETIRFFEELDAADAATVVDHVAQLPPGNERDVFFLSAIRRWAELDPAAALARADAVPVLPQRAAARNAVYEAWGARDATAAFDHALTEPLEGDRWRALSSLLTGAAVKYPGGAVTLWEAAPEPFRNSRAGRSALQRIAEVADGTGQRRAMRAIIAGLPAGRERLELTLALARTWGVHDPDGAVNWLQTAVPAGPALDSMIDEVFSAFVRRDPMRAATWAVQQTDERRRTNYIGTAVAEWATYDTAAAETWINEQQDGSYLDGAAYAIAAHFIETRHLQQAFAWTRRITRNETRAELLGNLGRIWSEDEPEKFATFLRDTSLNRFEREMLESKLPAPTSP